MSVDYDLVVIGNSTAGVYAAVTAAGLKARVALVSQQPLTRGGSDVADGLEQVGSNSVHDSVQAMLEQHILLTLGQTLQHRKRAAQLGIGDTPTSWAPPEMSAVWQQAKRWATATQSIAEGYCASAVLEAQGVEIIAGCGEFCRKPVVGFTVNGRLLRSRAYLLAIATVPVIPNIDGLSATGYLTPATLLQPEQALEKIQRWIILGEHPVGVELAQMLTRLGTDVTLVVRSAHILPEEDVEAAYLIQAQLEAEGIKILTQAEITQVRQIQNQKWVQVGNQAIEADEILLATAQKSDVAGLNLEAARVRANGAGIWVSDRLQTTNPQIYACLGLLNGVYFPHIAVYEARIALRNALFLPLKKINYERLPRVTYSEPQLASLGMTEPQARQRYGKNVITLRQHFKTLPKAHIQGDTTGFCQLILRQNGEILGAHLVGPDVSEFISAIALAMAQKLKVQDLSGLVCPSPTFSEILSQTVYAWEQQRIQQNPGLQICLERLFRWWRSGS